MTRTNKKVLFSALTADAETLVLSTLPWSCTHFGNQSEIEALIPATNSWETIADVHSVGNVDAEDLASFIVYAAQNFLEMRTLRIQIIQILKSYLNCDVLTSKLESEIRAVISALEEIENA